MHPKPPPSFFGGVGGVCTNLFSVDDTAAGLHPPVEVFFSPSPYLKIVSFLFKLTYSPGPQPRRPIQDAVVFGAAFLMQLHYTVLMDKTHS